MRRFMFVVLFSSLLLALPFMYKHIILKVEASPDIHQGDLVITGSNVTVIEDKHFSINGSIIVEENATLILKNAVVNFTQSDHWQYNMSFQNPLNGNPRLKATNTTIVSASDFIFNVKFFQNSSGSLLNCSIPWRGELHSHDLATVSVTNSTIRELQPNNNSTMIIDNSAILYVYLYHHCNVRVTNSTVESFVDYSDNAYLSVLNSTISQLDGGRSSSYVQNSTISWVYFTPESVNCSIKDFTVENVTSWNSLADFSIEISATGYAANMTIEDTSVELWRLTFYGESNITVANSTLMVLEAYSSSTMFVTNSTVGYVYSRGSSSVSIVNSTIIQHANAGDYSVMEIFDTDCHVWAEDFSIVRLISAECIVHRGFYSNASIYYCWYLSVIVIDSGAEDIPNAEVTAQYSNGTIAQQGTTNVNGKVDLILAEKVWNDTGQTYFGNYTVEASYWSYSDSTPVNMTENKKITLTLGGFLLPTAIYIRSDGSVDPSEAPIQLDENLYTLTDNIYLPVVLEKDNIVVDGAGYTLQGVKTQYSKGVDLKGRSNVTIRNLGISSFYYGVYLNSTTQSVLCGNHITNNEQGGIFLTDSSNNTIFGNSLTANSFGISGDFCYNFSIYGNHIEECIGNGILFYRSSNISIIGNHIANCNSSSITLYNCFSSYFNIIRNNIINNNRGIEFYSSSNNSIYHNNFVDNADQIYIDLSTNFLDNGFEGNYWSSYTGADLNHDGIGDTHNEIDAYNVDRYPLMGMFHSFNAFPEHSVNFISNSTIMDFQYFESNSTIKIRASNMCVNQTFGFCRVSIPKSMMPPPYTVVINSGLTDTLHFNNTIRDNGTHRWIYFAYQHSTNEIVITPEFSWFIITPLLIAMTLITILYNRRQYAT